MADTALKTIDHWSKVDLLIPESMAKYLSDQVSPGTWDLLPGLRYWNMIGEQRDYSSLKNQVGHQQRAFDLYWTIKCGIDVGRVILGLGSAGVMCPGMLTTDKFNGYSPDYNTDYAYSHMAVDADLSLPFHDDVFGGVVTNHVFEHLLNQELCFREMLRVTRPGGKVALIMPDMAHHPRNTIDPSHTYEFSADEFLEWLEDHRPDFPPFEILEHNTLDNKFSFNTVVERKA